MDAVVRLLTDAVYYGEVAWKGRRRVVEQYTWDQVAARFEAIVSSVEPKTRRRCLAPAGAPSERDGSIGVVIPVHNQAQYLPRAVESVLWQLGPRDELIIVDDGSTDLNGHAETHGSFHRVMWLKNEQRRGVSFSRNLAIRRSRAEWIKFLDADDVLAPFALDALRHALLEIPIWVQVVTGGCHRIVDGRYYDYLAGAGDSLKQILKTNPILPSATFVRREALLAVGLFDERIDFEEDWDLWLKLHERYGRKAFAVTAQPICYYWFDHRERALKSRAAAVDGIPVREYFRQRYGAEPQSDP